MKHIRSLALVAFVIAIATVLYVTDNAPPNIIKASAAPPAFTVCSPEVVVGGTVWLDVDHHGVVANVPVNLYIANGNDWDLIGSTTTDSNGAYTFSIAAEGNYKIKPERPPAPNNTGAFTMKSWSFHLVCTGGNYAYLDFEYVL